MWIENYKKYKSILETNSILVNFVEILGKLKAGK